jgi:hypothetical protein
MARTLEHPDLGSRVTVLDSEQADRGMEVEAARTGGAWIHDQARPTPFDQRLVRVAVHDHVG